MRADSLSWKLRLAVRLIFRHGSRHQPDEKIAGHTERLLRGFGRITGVKEGHEHGRHQSEFVAKLLKEALNLQKPPTIDWAHRTLRSKPAQDNLPPWAFVVKCHYFPVKESLLKKAMERRAVITTDGDHIRILLDFTQTMSKQRAAFTEVRGLVRSCEGVRYVLRYITTAAGQEGGFQGSKAG